MLGPKLSYEQPANRPVLLPEVVRTLSYSFVLFDVSVSEIGKHVGTIFYITDAFAPSSIVPLSTLSGCHNIIAQARPTRGGLGGLQRRAGHFAPKVAKPSGRTITLS